MKRALKAAVAALFGASALWTPAASAVSAPSPLTPIPARTVAQFTLTPDGASFTRNDAAIKAVERQRSIAVRSVVRVLDSGGRVGRPGACHKTHLDPRLRPAVFCWDRGDDTSNSYTEEGGWTPQGITGSHDATPGGLWNGRRAYLASWHFDRRMHRPHDAEPNKYARVSLVNATGRKITYNHILLVQPTPGGAGNFTAVTPTHADGAVWYGTRLFIANGRQLQVYDLRHIWKVNSHTERIGIVGGRSSARWSDYALPMIGSYMTTTGGRHCAAATGTAPCLTSLSLDRTGPALVSSEVNKTEGGRLVSWPLNPRTGLPATKGPGPVGKSHAVRGYRSSVTGMQGAATDGTTFYMAGDCMRGAAQELPPSCIYKARPSRVPVLVTTAPILTENLSFAPKGHRLVGLNERISRTGLRVVFSIAV